LSPGLQEKYLALTLNRLSLGNDLPRTHLSRTSHMV
jgi:hypothetical protein